MRNDERTDNDARIDNDERVGGATDAAVQPAFEQPNDRGFEPASDSGLEPANDRGFEQPNDSGFGQANDSGLEQASDRGFEQSNGDFRPPADNDDPTVELFSHEDVETFRASWEKVQTRFVDDPQAAVQDADSLVADVMRSLETTFADRKQEWAGDEGQRGSIAETENLRQALRRYRSFLDHLLNA